jgi:hypothetical protein
MAKSSKADELDQTETVAHGANLDTETELPVFRLGAKMPPRVRLDTFKLVKDNMIWRHAQQCFRPVTEK